MIHSGLGSGKSHTMIGSDADFGVVPRSVEYLLGCLTGHYTFKAKFFEIYNECFIDLLADNSLTNSKSNVNHANAGTQFERDSNLKMIQIESTAQFNETLKKVNENRKVSATARNSSSSRSHAVIQIKVDGKYANEKGEKIVSSVMFLDLAGCENVNDHLDNIDRGKTQNEMKNINKSVSNFQTVIESLKKKETAPDFRSSKLTYLLKPSLTTNTKTLMITTISQETKYLSTSKASLAVAQSAGQIKIKDVKKNREKI